MSVFSKWMLCGSLVLITGCNTIGLMNIPPVTSMEPQPINLPTDEQPSFALSKVIANIRRGTVIAHYPSPGDMMSVGVDGDFCNQTYGRDNTVEWGSGSSVLGNWSTELGEIFHEAMVASGLNVAGDPKDLFGQKKSISSAEYLIGARITEIKGNLCEDHSLWDGRPLREFSGEAYVKVEWTIFSNLQQREVVRIETEGYYKQVKVKKRGVVGIFHNAFAGASENLAASKEFIEFAKREGETSLAAFSGSVLSLKNPKMHTLPAKNRMNDILSAVVTVRVGMGHGSGFAINKDGYIMTNAHVVGDSKNATLILNNGIEIIGEVVRKSEVRDIALIKSPVRIPKPLAIRKSDANLLEDVYVIGSPKLEDLQSTITTGIVSALRHEEKTNLNYIQSDAAVSGGNSGGPMLDMNGNVIGVSVAKYTGENVEGLNLFIPIQDALDALKISIN